MPELSLSEFFEEFEPCVPQLDKPIQSSIEKRIEILDMFLDF